MSTNQLNHFCIKLNLCAIKPYNCSENIIAKEKNDLVGIHLPG